MPDLLSPTTLPLAAAAIAAVITAVVGFGSAVFAGHLQRRQEERRYWRAEKGSLYVRFHDAARRLAELAQANFEEWINTGATQGESFDLRRAAEVELTNLLYAIDLLGDPDTVAISYIWHETLCRFGTRPIYRRGYRPQTRANVGIRDLELHKRYHKEWQAYFIEATRRDLGLPKRADFPSTSSEVAQFVRERGTFRLPTPTTLGVREEREARFTKLEALVDQGAPPLDAAREVGLVDPPEPRPASPPRPRWRRRLRRRLRAWSRRGA